MVRLRRPAGWCHGTASAAVRGLDKRSHCDSPSGAPIAAISKQRSSASACFGAAGPTFTLLQNLNVLPDLQDEGLAYWGAEVADHCAWKDGQKQMRNAQSE